MASKHAHSPILSHIVRSCVPIDLRHLVARGSWAEQSVIQYVESSIRLAPVFVKGPELFFRPILFLALLLIRALLLFRRNFNSKLEPIEIVARVHPLLDDAIRLYRSLTLFAVYEIKHCSYEDFARSRTSNPGSSANEPLRFSDND